MHTVNLFTTGTFPRSKVVTFPIFFQNLISQFSDPTLLLIFAQFLISFLTVYINAFEKFFSLRRPIPVCKIPKKRDQQVSLSGF